MTGKPAPHCGQARPSAFPSDEKLANWTMRNNSLDFDAEEAFRKYDEHRAEFKAATEEFLKSF